MRVSARTSKDWTRAHRARQSIEKKNQIRVRDRSRKRIYRRNKLTQQQRQESLKQDRKRKRRKRSHQSDGQPQTTDSSDGLPDDN